MSGQTALLHAEGDESLEQTNGRKTTVVDGHENQVKRRYAPDNSILCPWVSSVHGVEKDEEHWCLFQIENKLDKNNKIGGE